MDPVAEETEVKFDVPDWAGRPPNGMHLDVLKGDKLVQKLMIDEKRVYFFGRNPKLCDFTIDHASCSRAHAALLYHKFLDRFFLFDLGSSHGSYIGRTRIEANTPVNIPMDSTIQFGASTRKYILRSKISSKSGIEDDSVEQGTGYLAGGGIQLPIKEEELQNLTEYNTALNRRIATVAITADDDHRAALNRKKHRWNVNFMDEDQIINPEDVDPSVGRFRNLVSTVVIPTKKSRLETNEADTFGLGGSSTSDVVHTRATHSRINHSNQDSAVPQPAGASIYGSIAAKLGLSLPNAAPDVDLYPKMPEPTPEPVMAPMKRPLLPAGARGQVHPVGHEFDQYDDDPMMAHKKKKYAKEAWPGKKPGQHLLL